MPRSLSGGKLPNTTSTHPRCCWQATDPPVCAHDALRRRGTTSRASSTRRRLRPRWRRGLGRRALGRARQRSRRRHCVRRTLLPHTSIGLSVLRAAEPDEATSANADLDPAERRERRRADALAAQAAQAARTDVFVTERPYLHAVRWQVADGTLVAALQVVSLPPDPERILRLATEASADPYQLYGAGRGHETQPCPVSPDGAGAHIRRPQTGGRRAPVASSA
jgi:hypothetical protein